MRMSDKYASNTKFIIYILTNLGCIHLHNFCHVKIKTQYLDESTEFHQYYIFKELAFL